MPDDKSELPIKAEISAKLEVKTEIPPDASGRAVHELLNAISPFTEGMGIVGAHLRVHREKVLIKIAKIARERLAIEGKAAIPIPLKFMVPFLEKASCEDIESDLIDLWAKLLVGASTNYDSSILAFVDILSQMGSSEAKLLRRLAGKNLEIHAKTFRYTDITKEFDWYSLFLGVDRGLVYGDKEADKLAEKLIGKKLLGPRRVYKVSVPYRQENFGREGVPTSPAHFIKLSDEYMKHHISFDILKRLGLLDFFVQPVGAVDAASLDFTSTISYAELSSLGYEFLLQCQGAE